LADAKGNAALFFPSYDFIERYRATLTSRCLAAGKQLLVEDRSMDKDALIRRFKAGRNALVVGVCRGSLSEGVDYPGEQMETVAVVGLPLAKYTTLQRRTQQYFSRRGLDGEDLTYNLPAIIAATQALGRCIRSEKDRGVLLLVENRYTIPKYSQLLPKWMRQEAKSVTAAQIREELEGGKG
jgi:DNA excision repair protein ERCC-2